MDLPDIAETRITFLNSGLDVANTFVELARTELDLDNREHCEAFLTRPSGAPNCQAACGHSPAHGSG